MTAKSGDGLDALEKALNLPPDLVLFDPLEPGVDGFEVLVAIEKKIRAQKIPLIIIKTKDERSDCICDPLVELEDYITKPFDIEELKLRVQIALRRK